MPRFLIPLLCAVAVAGASARADVLVGGKTLTIKDTVDPAKRKATFLSKDPGFVVGALDPTMGGAFLTLSSRACHCFGPDNTNCLPTQSSSSWYMPAFQWTPRNGAFTYKDKLLANGPVVAATMKNGQIKVLAKGAQMDYGLRAFLGQASGIRATLTVGVTPVCALFPGLQGVVKKDDPVKGFYSALKAEPPDACTDPPPFCQ